MEPNPISWAGSTDGYVDGTAPGTPQTPKGRGAPMTENSPGREREDRRKPTAANGNDFMTDGVDAIVQTMKAARLDAPFDRAVTQPQLAQLPARDNAVLTIRERRKSLFGSPWVTLSTHTVG